MKAVYAKRESKLNEFFGEYDGRAAFVIMRCVPRTLLFFTERRLKIMTKGKIIGICASVAAVAAIAVTALMLSGGEAYRILKIFEMNGSGKVDRPSSGVISAYESMKLENEDTLSVDSESTIRLSLDDDKYILLDQNTVMSFEAEGTAENSRTKINLVEGAILNEVTEPLSADSIYEVSTPNTTMAVRGTSFSVEVIPQENGWLTKLSVLHGTVSVQLYDENGNPKGSPVSVTEGFSVAIFTENKLYSAESAGAYGDAYFVFITEDGYTPVPEGESPLFPLERSYITEEIRLQALKSDESKLLELKISVADELRGKGEEPEQTTTTAETEAPASETTTTSAATTAETTTTTPETTTVTSAVTTAAPVTAASTTAPVTTVTTTVTTEPTVTATEKTTTAETTTTTTTTAETTTTTSRTRNTAAAATNMTIMPVITAATTTTTAVTTTTTAYAATAVTTTTASTTAPAVKYTVSFYDENGNEVYSEEVEENGTVSSIPDVPDKTGYTGIWTCNGAEYTGGTVTGNMTITAQYTINTYTVTYSADCDNADDIPAGGTYEYGDVITIPAVPAKAYQSSAVWTCNGTEYTEGQTVTVESDMEITAVYTPVKVEMQIMIPYPTAKDTQNHIGTITIDYGAPFSQNDAGLTLAELIEMYDDPTDNGGETHTGWDDTWTAYTVSSIKIGNTYQLTDDLVIDSTMIYEGTDENGDTVYTTTIYFEYGYRELTVTYLIYGYGTDLNENGYGVYTTETTTYENYYDLIDFPAGYSGYWGSEPDSSESTESLYVSADTTFYGVLTS